MFCHGLEKPDSGVIGRRETIGVSTLHSSVEEKLENMSRLNLKGPAPESK